MLIVIDPYPFFLQVADDVGRHFTPVDVECSPLTVDEQIADDDGIAVNIIATKVERPGDVIERGHQHAVSMLLPQGTTHPLQFLTGRFTGIFQRQDIGRCLWHRRPSGPYLAQRIQIGAQRIAPITSQLGNEFAHIGRGHDSPVHSNLGRGPAPYLRVYPLRDGRRTWHLQPHQLKLGVMQLLLCRNEIA